MSIFSSLDISSNFLSLEDLRDKYRNRYKKHKIHIVDNRKRIRPKEVNVDEFAVKLQISRDKPSVGNFTGEMRRQFYGENWKHFASDDIEISQLNNKDSRVTFIRGVAGMGKSVLAKQLTVWWANGYMYTNFKLCIMFQCRDLNFFQRSKGAKLEKHEVFEEFLKSIFNFELGDGEGILFVVDGLDELYDITTDDSVIAQLLNKRLSKFIKSKIIITGRPHIEENLVERGNEMGGIQTVQIQGLDDKQIDEYISKFSSLQADINAINKSKDASRRTLPILHVPQFLNTFCCVAILTEGKAINNEAELYSWTLYLLLLEHADKLGSLNKTVSEIFKEYSEALMALSEVCHNLLNENKIIFEGEVESLVKNLNTGKNFIKSLFVDVSDHREKKFEFKHLSIMEFFAALFICNNKNPKKIIEENLDKGFIEVVSFACRLIAGVSSDGIIKDILTNSSLPTVESFLNDVIKLLNGSRLDDETKFQRSIAFLSFFLNKNFKHKEVILSFIKQLRFPGYLSGSDSSNLLNICNHLVEVCACNENDIRMAFGNVLIQKFAVNGWNPLQCVKYFKFEKFDLFKFKFTLKDFVKKMNENELIGKGKEALLLGCEVNDANEVDINDIPSCEVFKSLTVLSCKLNASSFESICELGVLCKDFRLYNQDIESVDWWEALVRKIEERKIYGDLKLRELNIANCTTAFITEDMKIRVRRFTNSMVFISLCYLLREVMINGELMNAIMV